MLVISHVVAGRGLAPLPARKRAADAVTSGSLAISSLIRARTSAAVPMVPAGAVMSGSPAGAVGSWLVMTGLRGRVGAAAALAGRGGGGEAVGEGAALGALGVQRGLGAGGALGGGLGQGTGGVGLRLAGGLQGGVLAGCLLTGGVQCLAGGLPGRGQVGGGPLGVVPGGRGRGVAAALGGGPFGCRRCGLVLGVRGALHGGLQLPGQDSGLRLQLAGLLSGSSGAGFGGGPGVFGGVGGLPRRGGRLGGLGRLGGGGGRVRLGAAAGRFGLGHHGGCPLGIGLGDLAVSRDASASNWARWPSTAPGPSGAGAGAGTPAVPRSAL